jgi:hypothetical protein
LFGSIGEADEVYVNGRRIGGLGSISRSYLLAPFQPRLYRVPPGTLRPDTENVIAVRVMRFLWTDDPITPPWLFGNIDQLRDSLDTPQQLQLFTEGLLVGSSALSLIFWCFLIICGARDRSFVAFGPVLCCYGLAVFLDSRVCFDLGWRTSITERALAVATMILPAAGVHFVSQFCLGRSPALFRWIFVLPSVLLSVLLAFASMFDGWVWFSVITAWHLLVAAAVLIALANVGTALWRGKQESWALMVGAVVGIAATAIELGGPGYNRLFGIAVGNHDQSPSIHPQPTRL